MKSKIHFSHKSDEWQTPPELFNSFQNEFGSFGLDVAATMENKKCPMFYDLKSDSLSQPWMKRNWCNPPYSRLKDFVKKASEESDLGKMTVMLIPARTDTAMFHDYIYQKPNVEIRFLRGRIKFINPDSPLLRCSRMNGSNNAAPFPSMVVIFKPKK